MEVRVLSPAPDTILIMARAYGKAFFDSSVVPLEEASLSITSSAVLYGLSVYTVFPVSFTKDGPAAFRLADHFARLLNSAKIIGIDSFESAWTRERFEEAVWELIKANDLKQDALVRATVHVTDSIPGVRSRGLTTALSMFIYDTAPILPQSGARLKTSVWRRVPDYAIPSRAKVNGAYVNSVLGKQDALDSGYDDCLFLDTSGHVCELSAANIFMVRDGVLLTPSTSSDILEGITRRTVLEFAREMGLTPVEREIDLTELYIADEIFACGTSAAAAPIIEIDKRRIGNGIVGPITSALQKKYREALHGEDPRYLKLLTRFRSVPSVSVSTK